MALHSNIVKRDIREWLRFCEQVQASTSVNMTESKASQEERIKRALSDYNYYVKTYFPIYAQADCAWFHIRAANKIKTDPNIFAILEWAREHAKSVHADIFLPMWLLAHGQLTGMILMGKNETDACNLLSDVQAQLQYNELFCHDFGDQYNIGSWEQGDFTTRQGVRFTAIGREQSPRGFRRNEKRPNYGVIDDIDDDEIVNNPRRVQKVVKNIMGAFYFALSIKGSRVVMAGNRIHHNSILANIVGDTRPGAPKRKGIYHLKVCATTGGYYQGKPEWSERYTLEELRRKMDKAGPVRSRVEFYHEHLVEGKIFLNKYIFWKPVPSLKKAIIVIGYFDPSFENTPTSDYKAIRVWALFPEGRYCIKSYVRRSELTSAFHWMVNFEKSLPEGTGVLWYVEQQFFNRPIRDALDEVRKITGHNLQVLMDTRQKENKFVRILKMEPRYSLGGVFYNQEEMHDPDMLEGNNQLMAIEPGYHSPDDAPDADEGAWHYLDQHLPGRDFKPVIGKRYNKKGW